MCRPKPGDQIGNYVLEERIGAGTFGEVWRARHRFSGETAAVKIPIDDDCIQALRREGLLVHGLCHPNIVRVVDARPYAERPYLAMEYVAGRSLRQWVADHPDGLPVGTAVTILEAVLTALDAAHAAGVIHRDIKPENILIAGGKETGDILPRDVKVTDFGLAAAGGPAVRSILQSGSDATNDARRIAGTFAYMSPEQREGRPVDARSDLYSCGVLLFEMLTGERPAGSDLPGHIRHDVPAALDALFQRLHTRCDRRLASAAEAMRSLPGAEDLSTLRTVSAAVIREMYLGRPEPRAAAFPVPAVMPWCPHRYDESDPCMRTMYGTDCLFDVGEPCDVTDVMPELPASPEGPPRIGSDDCLCMGCGAGLQEPREGAMPRPDETIFCLGGTDEG